MGNRSGCGSKWVVHRSFAPGTLERVFPLRFQIDPACRTLEMEQVENQSTAPSWESDLPARPKVAYLLADAGIGFRDSRKGCSIHARSMVRAFEQEGCEVDVYIMRSGRGPDHGFKVMRTEQSSLTRWWLRYISGSRRWTRRLPFLKSPGGGDNCLTALGWKLWQWDYFRYVCRKFSERPPDLIYARSAWFAWPYAKLKNKFGVPLLLEVNAIISKEKRNRGEGAFDSHARRIEKESFECSDRILPVSAELKDQILDFGISSRKIVVTPNAVDMDLFHPIQETAKSGRDLFVIGAANSMRAYHGMLTLLKATRLLRRDIPCLKLVLIGGGFEFEQIRRTATVLGVDDITEFTGVIDHSDVPERLRECDVCVAPYEGDENQYNCPMKLYEYMSLKIPIVASAWGDIPNIVRHGETALLHAPGDEADLARSIREVRDHPGAAWNRAERAWSEVKCHTWRGIARDILDFCGVYGRV